MKWHFNCKSCPHLAMDDCGNLCASSHSHLPNDMFCYLSAVSSSRSYTSRLIWPVRQRRTRLSRLGEDVQPILRHFNLFNWNFICFALEINCVSGRINQTAVHIRMGRFHKASPRYFYLDHSLCPQLKDSLIASTSHHQVFFRRGHLSLLALLKWTDMVHLLFDNHQRFSLNLHS